MNEHNNRTHPIFQGTTNTNTVNLGITTKCTMNCPNCSVGVPTIKADGTGKHQQMGKLAAIGLAMSDLGRQPLRRVHITGGEPTMHPFFEDISRELKRWFIGTEYLTLETNGAAVLKHMRVIQEVYDLVFITHYVKDAIYPDNPDNFNVILEAEEHLGEKLITEPPVKHTRKHEERLSLNLLSVTMAQAMYDDEQRAEHIACSKWFDPGLPCAVYEDKIYPCCVTFGIDPKLGIPITRNWRNEITKLNKGCLRCCFRET